MHRLCLLALLTLSACQITQPLAPRSTTNPSPQSEPSAVVTASASVRALAVTLTSAPTLTPAPTVSPTLASTLTPTPTAIPLSTPTSTLFAEPVVLIERPLPDEFVSGTISVMGRVAHAAGGSVAVELRAPNGAALQLGPVAAVTTPSGDGISFAAEVTFDLPPTPRPSTLHVVWSDDAQARSGQAIQTINLPGRYGRVARLSIEVPAPFTRVADATIAVKGVAPGPPAKVLARLLDDADQVLEAVEAHLLWRQADFPCAFAAALPNNPAATEVQVITLGPDDAVIEAARVRLEPRR